MIVKIPLIFALCAYVKDVSSASFSKVYVQNGHDYPYEYLHYGAPSVSYSPQIAHLTAAPAGSVVPYSSNYIPCGSPCIYPGQVASIAPSANIVQYQTPSLPVVVEPPRSESSGYEYSYLVYDDQTGDHKAQRELSDGSVVRGGYSFLQPDGLVREVQYVADDLQGFNAVVKNYVPAIVENKKHEHPHAHEPAPCHEDKNKPLTHHEEHHEAHHEPEGSHEGHGHDSHHAEPSHEEIKAHKHESHHEIHHEPHGGAHEKHHEEHQEPHEGPHEKHHEEHHIPQHEEPHEEHHEEHHEPEHHEPKHHEEHHEEHHEPEHHEPKHHEEHHEEHHEPEHHEPKHHEEHHEEPHEPEHGKHHEEHHEEHHEPKNHEEHHEEPHEPEHVEHHDVHAEAIHEHPSNGHAESHEGHDKPEAHETPVHHRALADHNIDNSNILVPYNDIIRCVQAAINGVNEASPHQPESPLTYIILNKPC